MLTLTAPPVIDLKPPHNPVVFSSFTFTASVVKAISTTVVVVVSGTVVVVSSIVVVVLVAAALAAASALAAAKLGLICGVDGEELP